MVQSNLLLLNKKKLKWVYYNVEKKMKIQIENITRNHINEYLSILILSNKNKGKIKIVKIMN